MEGIIAFIIWAILGVLIIIMGIYDMTSVKMAYGDTVLDTDITALVYPKYIKLESHTGNISGTVTENA